jgi:glycosyltransferase involved in cell wall biosynthesis
MKTEPFISVVIPARNEETNIGFCLESLVAQKGIKFEIIVVDDGSTDQTAKIARQYTGVTVIPARPLPRGWVGKSNALCTGVAIARGRWYLFTDADTQHLPGSLSASFAEANAHNVIMLSYSPAQKTGAWWDKLIQPLIFAELNKAFDYSEVSDPQSTIAAANGQYILFEKGAYNNIGGHAAVHNSILEDVQIAGLAKRIGRIRFRYAPDAVTCRMYQSFSQLTEGWTKNLALLFPDCAFLAFGRTLEFLLIVAGPLISVGLILQGFLISGLALVGLTTWSVISFAGRVLRGGFGPSSLVSVLGLPIYASLLVRSIYRRRVGRVDWKGRTYPSIKESSEP